MSMQTTPITLLDGTIFNAIHCPYCGSHNLMHEVWCDDDGEIDAVACMDCESTAKASVWNMRVAQNNPGLDEALNSGDGTYRP